MRWNVMSEAERCSAIMEGVAEGLSMSELGQRLATTKNAVLGFAYRRDLPRRRACGQVHDYEQIRRLSKAGYRVKEISQRLGIPPKAVESVIYRLRDRGDLELAEDRLRL